MAATNKLQQQLDFLLEIDKVKSIIRQTRLFDGSRRENDAEHAWHVCMMAWVFKEYANQPKLNITKVIQMLLIHDIVEIDAGDVLVYDTLGRQNARAKEEKAAERIFGILPESQKSWCIHLWLEFEACESEEAKFAAALDRLEPIMQNMQTKGYAWKKHRVSREMVEAKNRHIKAGSGALWQYVCSLLDEAESAGFFGDSVNNNFRTTLR